MKVEEKIFLEENELKPNRYVANVMLYAIPAALLVLLLNLFGIFHVNQTSMALCCITIIACGLIVQLLGRKQSIASKRNTKFFILLLVYIATFAVIIVLAQWTELLIALPITLSMQYHNKKIMRFAIVNAFIIAAFSFPLSILLGLPQLNYYEYLIRALGFQIDAISPAADYDVLSYMLSSFLYVSIPRCIVVGALSLVIYYITKLVSMNIRTRAEVTYLSSMDVLTGLFNRLSYEEKIASYRAEEPRLLTCIYADADGLHELNNELGHSAGDEMLRTCADAMLDAFGDLTYRIGGDEFVSFIETDDIASIENGMDRVRQDMRDHGYHISIGACVLGEDGTISDIIRTAEQHMYEEKHAYYSQEANDRRKPDNDRRRIRG